MGTSQSHASNKFILKFSAKYDFVLSTKDQNLGAIKIYRKKEPFFDYVMVAEKVIPLDLLISYQSQLQAIYFRNNQTEEQSMLLKLYAHEILSSSSQMIARGILGTQCQSDSVGMRLFVEYYNFTLKQLIEYKHQHKARFSLDEVMYVLWNVVRIFRFFEGIKAMNVQFLSNDIFVTPEGQIRFSPMMIFESGVQNIGSDRKLMRNDSNMTTQCIQSIDCLQPKTFTRTFQMQQKLIVYEIKKLLGEMSEMQGYQRCKDKEGQQLFLLRKYINNASTVGEIQKLLYLPEIDRIQMGSGGVIGQTNHNKMRSNNDLLNTQKNNTTSLPANSSQQQTTTTRNNPNNYYLLSQQHKNSPINSNLSEYSSSKQQLRASKISVKNYVKKDITHGKNHQIKYRPLSQQQRTYRVDNNNNNF